MSFPARDVEVEAVVDDRFGELLAQAADGDMGAGMGAGVSFELGGCGRPGGVAGQRRAARMLIEQRISTHCHVLVQNACRYLVTSTFSGRVPTCTEKSMNFWKSALSLAVRSLAMK